MADQRQTDILRRMVGLHKEDVVESPLTSSRAVRMALIKAAQDSVGLNLSVKSIAEVVQPLEDMLAALSDDQMLVGLHRDADPVGLIVLDIQMRTAVLEIRTVGAVNDKPADGRAPTGTDKRLSDPFLASLMQALPQAVIGTEFEGWLDGARPMHLVPSVKAAGLILPDKQYRILRLTVTFGGEARQGEIILCLPLSAVPDPPVVHHQENIDWDTEFHATVSEAALTLDAQLHRFDLPLHRAHNLKIGDVLPLPGCTVSSVRLLSLDGHVVRQAKLGQSGGKRAIRIEAAPLPVMGELVPSVGIANIASPPEAFQADALQADALQAEALQADAPQTDALPDFPAMMPLGDDLIDDV